MVDKTRKTKMVREKEKHYYCTFGPLLSLLLKKREIIKIYPNINTIFVRCF